MKQAYFRAILGFAVLLAGGAAQPLISFGVKGGVPLTEPTSNGDESKRYVVGPSIEVRLPWRLAVEADALYQRVGSTNQFGSGADFFSERIRSNQWTFPVLGKYYLPTVSERWQPFLGAGWAFRRQWVSSTFSAASGTPLTLQRQVGNDWEDGPAFAAGVRIRAGRFAVTPEFRYTRWRLPTFQQRRNDASFLLGFSF